MFEIILNLSNEQVVVKCKVPKTQVASAFMNLAPKDPVKAQELIYNETVLNKEQLEPIFEKYPFAKLSIINKIMERLGLTTDAIIKEVEEEKN